MSNARERNMAALAKRYPRGVTLTKDELLVMAGRLWDMAYRKGYEAGAADVKNLFDGLNPFGKGKNPFGRA